MSHYLKQIQQQAEQKLIKNGTMTRIDAKQAQHLAYAQSLGYDNAQQAYNALGKKFIEQANAYRALSPSIQKALAGFVSLVSKGWETELAFECSYDSVYDELGKEDFLNLCQQAVKEKATAQQN